jgi:predicted lipoprotein with Yx(FWY)xxD motif
MTRRRPLTFLAAAVALPLVALVIAGCGGGSGGSYAATAAAKPPPASGSAAKIGVASAGGLGKILVDSRGHSLYLFQADSGMTSSCTGECADEWPPLRSTGKPVAGNGIDASKLGTISRSDGEPQVTYNGHPLYGYAGDAAAGDASGQGLDDFGGLWYVVSPAGSAITGSH